MVPGGENALEVEFPVHAGLFLKKADQFAGLAPAMP